MVATALCRYVKRYFREGQGRDAVLITLTTELKSGQHPVSAWIHNKRVFSLKIPGIKKGLVFLPLSLRKKSRQPAVSNVRGNYKPQRGPRGIRGNDFSLHKRRNNAPGAASASAEKTLNLATRQLTMQ